jgi:hypothetical protein
MKKVEVPAPAPEVVKLGIDALKNLIGAAVHTVNRVVAITDPDSPGGKKITAMEGVGSAMVLFDMIPAILNAKQGYAQLLDMDDAEKAELITWAKEELALSSEKAEEFIMQCLKAFVEIAKAVDLATHLKTV